MTDCRDIYRVSIPLCCGILASATVLSVSHRFCAGYIMASVAAAVLFIAAALLGKEGHGQRRNAATWIFIMFALGTFCYSTREVILPGRQSVEHLSSLHSGLEESISRIHFNDPENNALTKALILGDRNSLSRSTTNNFRRAGAAHLLALSGMHLGIIYLLVNKVLCLLGNTIPARKIRNMAVIILTGLYTLLCGAGSSLVRAWLFIMLNESAKLLDRPQPPAQILCSALTIHIICRPESINDIGFQMSYLAMTGIVFLWPVMRKWYIKEDVGKTPGSIIWDTASLSISCQVFTAPLTLLYFGTFPKYFLITNLIAAPLTTVVMCCCLCALALSGIWPECPPVILEICELPLTALRGLLEAVAGLD